MLHTSWNTKVKCVRHIGKRKRVASSFQRKQDVKVDKDVFTVSNNKHPRLSVSQVTARETDTESALDPAWEPSYLPYNTKTSLRVWLSSWLLQELRNHQSWLWHFSSFLFQPDKQTSVITTVWCCCIICFFCYCKPMWSFKPHNSALLLLYQAEKRWNTDCYSHCSCPFFDVSASLKSACWHFGV